MCKHIFYSSRAGVRCIFNSDHLLALREERRVRNKNRDDVNDAKLKGLVRNLNVSNSHFILCVKITYAWLNLRFTTVTGKVLTATGFRDFYTHVVMLTPPTFRENAAAMENPFDVRHTLRSSKGYLVIARHNKVL